MADLKISELTNLTAADPANDMIPIVDVSATPPASGSTKRISINNILACSPTATLASATISGDLTVATDRLKVVTGSTAIQIGATTQTQFGTTAWPTSYIGKSGSKVLIGNTGELILWNEAAAAIGNNSALYVGAKSGPAATIIAGGAINGGIENTSDYSGFLTLSTQRSDASMIERYRIDSTGVATWSNVGGVAGTAMTLNSTGLGVGASPTKKLEIAGTASATVEIAKIGATSGPYVGIGTEGTNYSWIQAFGGAPLYINPQGNNTILNPSSGNVGIGVTPANWATIKALQVGSGASLFGYTATEATLSGNTYYNAGFKYVANGEASQYQQQIGEHRWYSASNNTLGAGQPITFLERMRLKATGQLRFVPLASDPSGAEAGDVYYNSTSNKLKCYNGTTWNDLF